MATKKISATKLAKETADILDRVAFKGERFVVERRGKRVCRILPAERKRCTAKDLVEALERFGPFGVELGNAVKDLRSTLEQPRPPSW